MGFFKKVVGEEDNYDEINFDENVEYGIDDVLEDEQEVDLQIDLYEDENNLYLRTFIPVLEPKEIDVDVSRDKIVISGTRIDKQAGKYDYFKQELPWGKFNKQVILPKEINIEKIKSSTKNGLLTLKLPKIDKDKMVKISLD